MFYFNTVKEGAIHVYPWIARIYGPQMCTNVGLTKIIIIKTAYLVSRVYLLRCVVVADLFSRKILSISGNSGNGHVIIWLVISNVYVYLIKRIMENYIK